MQEKFWHKIVVVFCFVSLNLTFCGCSQQKALGFRSDDRVEGENGYFCSLQQALKCPDSVKCLILKKQKLTEFPTEVLQMTNIERLDLSRNSIREIPAAIDALKKLHYVNFAQNYLTELPEQMSKLPIDTLILWDNQIRAFDESFKQMDLKFLDLRAIQMTRKEQRKIKEIFPAATIKKDHPCNCGR